MINLRFRCGYNECAMDGRLKIIEIHTIMSDMSKNISDEKKLAKMLKNVMEQYENQ